MEAVPKQKRLKERTALFLMAKLGQTYGGRVKQNAFANRVYNKPSLHHVVIRHPGVIRRSEKVVAINAKLEAVKKTPNAPATKCGATLEERKRGIHKPWPEFISCMRGEMKSLVGKTA
jgi:hypothetical protein